MSGFSLSRTIRRIKSHPVSLIAGRFSGWLERFANLRSVRFSVRSGAVAMLGAVVGYGLLAGDHLSDPSGGARGVPAQISSYLGYAAEEVRIIGLNRNRPEAVLKAVGIMPGGSLIGFDPNHARRILLNLDWVEKASIRVVPPNRLEVQLTEREPFAIWQRDGLYFVIDRQGTAMASFDARKFTHLMLISGDGAQNHVSHLVNQLEAWPGVKSVVKAAARAGDRRWTLHFAGGRRALLPEAGAERALARLADLISTHEVLKSGVQEIDLRQPGSVALVPFDAASAQKDKIARAQ